MQKSQHHIQKQDWLSRVGSPSTLEELTGRPWECGYGNRGADRSDIEVMLSDFTGAEKVYIACGYVVCFPHSLQFTNKLVEQLLHHTPAASRAEPGKSAMIRCLLILRQPSEVDAVLAGLLQLPAGVDPTKIAVYQYLEQYPWTRCRFSPFG